jgi:hypothetical protein
VPRLRGHRFNVPAEAHDKIVDRARVCIFVEIPDILEDGFAGYGPAAILDQIAQKFSLHQGQLEDLAGST